MNAGYELREIPLSISAMVKRVEGFLGSCGLRLDSLDRLYGVYDSDDNLMAVGGRRGNVVKDVAVHPSLQGESVTNTLMGRIEADAFVDGIEHLKVFTKPSNEKIFASLGFVTVGRASRAILMENDREGISRYCRELSNMAGDGRKHRGVVVMNCNPLTIGHLYLIEQAASLVDRLFIIPVREDVSEFTAAERDGMIRRAVSRFSNVTVCPGSEYVISAATFPSYFIKEADEAVRAQMELDLDIFANHIAPALSAGVRFVGCEPSDGLTALYNEAMKKILPLRGIDVEEIKRLEVEGIPVSASIVRRLIAEGMAGKALKLVPSASIPVLLAHAATIALRSELDLTPKPGLVDCDNSGAHSDMDYAIMSASIAALQPNFARLAELAMSDSYPEHERVAEAGILAEKAMLTATAGVNTHRGALFSIGLTVMAAAHALSSGRRLTADTLRNGIGDLAEGFHGTPGSHGDAVRRKYQVRSITAMARDGFSDIFECWLPYYRSVKPLPESRHMLLLKIMTSLDDTNIYHRGGAEGALLVRETAGKILEDFSMEKLRKADELFISRNLSPGGSADMLALTLLVDSLLD